MLAGDLGNRIVTVPMSADGTGVDLDVLERKVREERAKVDHQGRKEPLKTYENIRIVAPLECHCNPENALVSRKKWGK